MTGLRNLGTNVAALGNTFPRVLKPEQFGAVGDGVADDTAAVVAAFAAATALRITTPPYTSTVVAPGATVRLEGKYNLASLSGPIIASCNIDATNDAVFIVPAAYADTALFIGHETSGRLLHDADITAPMVRKSSATAMTAGSVGVKVQNIYHSRIRLRRVIRFERGYYFTGLGQGTAYNTIHLGWIDLCKIAHSFIPGSGGWVNSNRFVGGGVTQSANTLDGGTTADKRRTGWRHVVIDGSGGNGTVNSNTFDGVSYEGDLSELYFDVKYATNNEWIGATRFEQGTAAVATTLATDTFTTTAHGFAVDDMVVLFATVTKPVGMDTGVPYWVQAVPDANTFKVAATKGGPAVTFGSNGLGLVFYAPPRVQFDGTGANTKVNRIEPGYYSYPGPLDVRVVNGATANTVAPSTPLLAEQTMAKNKLINPAFRVNQRGYVSAAFVASGSFALDRWKSTANGSSLTFTAAPQGQAVTVGGSFSQTVEQTNIEPGVYTLSWKGSATGRIYNSGASAPSYAASPITVALDGSTDVVVEFLSGRVEEPQLEKGSNATPFERRPVQVEQVLCKRYFYRWGALTGSTVREPLGVGAAVATTNASFAVALPVEMRTTPTVAVNGSTVSTLRVNQANAIFNPSAIAVASPGSGARNIRLQLTCTGLTTGSALFADTGDSNACVDLSAEL